MSSEKSLRQSYLSLYRHNFGQYAVFIAIFATLNLIVFFSTLPVIQVSIIENYLDGTVHNRGDSLRISIESPLNAPQTPTHPYYRWAIDIYKGTSQEARYWFNPVISLSFPVIMFSFLISLLITANLPLSIGLMRHKILREISNILDNWHLKIYGSFSEDNNKKFSSKILSADTKELLDFAEQWELPSEDLRYFQKVLQWRNGNALYKLLNSWTSLKFYLRFYFTDKYSNFVLGLVYIGAAVLIIIIGMRGLKFIPSTQPSLVFFALGLEFSVLITYAFTIMYSRSDNESTIQTKKQPEAPPLLSDEFGNNKEIENLLRAFIGSGRKQDSSDFDNS